MAAISKDQVLKALPNFIGEWPKDEPVHKEIIVVLDDDPTGTQTVNNVPVITSLTSQAIEAEFRRGTNLFYILTNSRSLTESETIQLHQELGNIILSASKKYGKNFQLISRSDSTLRGHFPAETNTIGSILFNGHFLTILVPAFFEGGRYTINNIHYVEDQGKLIPAADTPFASDKAFGYANSHLYKWILEKDPTLCEEDIADISVQDLRTDSMTELTDRITSYSSKKVLIINAMEYEDLRRFTAGLRHAHAKKAFNYLFRSAASIVPVLGGIDRKPILSGSDLADNEKAGLIVVGSYVPKTTNQLNELIANADIKSLEVQATRLNGPDRKEEISQKVHKINRYLKEGHDVVLYTTRKLIAASGKSESLKIINSVSSGVVEIVKGIQERPAYLIAKGGITSSDIATQGLEIARAEILGQILPGVPVWKSGDESKFPGLSYIVFPGNVGDDQALLHAYKKLKEVPK